MKIIKLYTGEDSHSHFCEIDTGASILHELGMYSLPYPVKNLMFREFESERVFDWHNAPQPQYIVYLEGQVEVEVSSGEKRVFKQGDILYATDLTGSGHISRTLSKGRSVVITTQ